MSNKKNKQQHPVTTHDEMIAGWKKSADFQIAYDALEEEFKFLREMLIARKRAGLTQEDVANRMGTKAPAIARLEGAGSRDKHSPSINTLRKYAQAVGCKLEIHLKPLTKKKLNEKLA